LRSIRVALELKERQPKKLVLRFAVFALGIDEMRQPATSNGY
jgi:hypothetical protein